MSVDLRALKLDPSAPAFFRWRQVGDNVVITNFEGNFLILSEDEFRAFAEGRVEPASDLHRRLDEGNFLRATYDVDRAAERYARRKSFLNAGVNLGILVVTLRCNETCIYCHASRANMDAVHTDMTPEIAEKGVDLLLQTTSEFLTIEFQGGEPLVNFPVVKRVIEYAKAQNEKIGKRLEFTMVSNLALMDEEKLAYLMANKVQICTSIDGPEKLHNAQRKLPTMDAHQQAVRWIHRINQEYEAAGLDPTLYHVEALLTTTRDTLPLWKEVVDTYVRLGCRALFLRPIDPFGFAERTRQRVEYPRAEYLAYYRRSVDYMIELNRQGVEILERFAAIFLTKILRGEDPNFLDVRSPAGTGIGQMAINYDGTIFTCDEGRMLHEMGDDTFFLGHVDTHRYRQLVGHETVRAAVVASNLDGQPDCVNCAYSPYCGTIPATNHKTSGSIFGRMRESDVCAVHKGIQDYLFQKLATADAETRQILERWTTQRPREHFVQGPGEGPGES
ncbi:MAG: His-Xaa-Ser system radical SAM maturase HxsB [Myxococcales bacterium]|nr:His-Xaa-Ser system radical SAM maturase HxsB [Myxococcales bacterium]MCB9704974.1 His-Xaa-Ser system radical SAM maturase HxsB [Myxococcales bacterium]